MFAVRAARPVRAVSARALLLAAVLARASGHGAGVWRDPHHYRSNSSLAGLRFISESPPHELNIVGTDDGTSWWALKGRCSGLGMRNITIDFSPKGGPSDATGRWAPGETITWPDGNIWALLAAPTRAFLLDAADDHTGVFFDPHHFKVGTFRGMRFIAEDPPHVLKMVGSDDGTFWFLEGSCTGPKMTSIHFDFSPKGGPKELVGKWAPAPARTITWPDGNVWSKAVPELQASFAVRHGGGTVPSRAHVEPSPTHASGSSLPVLVAAVVMLALAAAVRRVLGSNSRGAAEACQTQLAECENFGRP